MNARAVAAALALVGAPVACSSPTPSESPVAAARTTSTPVTAPTTVPPASSTTAPPTKQQSAKEYLRISELSRAATTAWNKMPSEYSAGSGSSWRKACTGVMNADAKQMEAYSAWEWPAKTQRHIDDLVDAIAIEHESMRQCSLADDPATSLTTSSATDANGDAMAAATKARLTLGLPVNRS